MKENQTNREPLPDLAYDWVTIIQHKSEALRAYQEYIRDAQQANSPECVQLMQQIYEQDARHVEEATRHLIMVLQGQMGQGQASQGGQMGQGQKSSQGTMSGAGRQGEMGGRMGQGSTTEPKVSQTDFGPGQSSSSGGEPGGRRRNA